MGILIQGEDWNRAVVLRENTAYKMSRIKKKQSKKKKKLSYNSREISSQILRVSRSVGASQVLVRAKGKVAQLQRCAATGDYDVNAVRAALIHAKRMVSCARKKLRNMKEEEQMQGKIRNPRKKIRNTAEEILLKQQLQELRRKHRGEESNKIKEADVRYIKEKIRQEQREASENNSEMTEMLCQDIPLEEVQTEAVGGEAIPTATVDVLL